MFKILTLNKIAKCGLDKLDTKKYEITDDAASDADGIILRSFAMHDMELGENLKAVARAGAGVNNIPIDRCTEKGIAVFNTPGANANAVKELTIAGLLISSRDIFGGIEWAKGLSEDDGDVAKQIEKGKSAFAGCEIEGKTLGVIGLGAIGIMVANAAKDLGMNVIGYDPYLSVEAALKLSRAVKTVKDIKDIYANSDYITLHIPLNDSTKGTVNTEAFEKMKKGVRIMNFSRGGLVDTDALRTALADGTVAKYVVDFPDKDTVKMANVIAIPHLGASTAESEDNCAIMAASEMADYLENGNIKNSVNLPNCSSEREGKERITIIHKNVPDMISKFSSALTGINIAHMTNKSKKEIAYTIIDTDDTVSDSISEKISEMDNVICVRVIK